MSLEDSYYHVYARGASKQAIFIEPSDFRYFEHLFSRYLSNKPASNREGFVYPHYANKIDLVAYCLMGNHFHLLIFQKQANTMSRLLQSVIISYSRYFNLKYNRTGSLFESRYKASIIDSDRYLQHVSRYIHLNPRYWKHYKYSSLKYYLSGDRPEWLKPERILTAFDSPQCYFNFVADYEGHHQILEDIKHELADI